MGGETHLPSNPSFVNPTLTFTGLTDIGRVRARNEDHLVLLANDGIAVVADGMGGHPGGDVASRITAEVVGRRLSELPQPTPDGEQSTASVLGHAMAESVPRSSSARRGPVTSTCSAPTE